MQDDFTFKALGTRWCLSLSGEKWSDTDKETINDHITHFERRFSRFLPDSEVNAFREKTAGRYPISDEFARLLTEADRLRTLTGGVYDPAAGSLLEQAGYDASYRLTPSETVNEFILPQWRISGNTLHIDNPVTFDLGGIGKGYCIDRVADLMKKMDYRHFVVDAGGDMYATAKHDGSPWKVAIEYPGKQDTVAGVVALKDQAIAVSDSFRRRWGNWHHIVDPLTKKAIENVIGAVAIAPSAWHADCMTSALFLAPASHYAKIAPEYRAQYLAFKENEQCFVSSNWLGELF